MKQKFTKLFTEVINRLEQKFNVNFYMETFSDWSGWIRVENDDEPLFGFSCRKELQIKLNLLKLSLDNDLPLTIELIRLILSWDGEELV